MTRTVWQRLLDWLSYGESELVADQVCRWDKRQWQEALELRLLRELELAESVVCDQCGDPHWADVNWWVPGVRACVSCPTEGPVDIEIDKLRQWRIDVSRVAELAAASFGLYSPVEMLVPDRLWRIGRRRLGGRYFDIFLCVGRESTSAEMMAAIRRSVGRASTLLLTVSYHKGEENLLSADHLVDFISISRLDGSKVVVDMDYLEERLAGERPVSKKPPRSIPVPGGAAWSDVSITVFDEFLSITIDGSVREISYADIGTDQQSQPIQLLSMFAAAGGTLGVARLADALNGETPLKSRILRLRQFLQNLVDIDGDPFSYVKKAQTYTSRFQVGLDRVDGFRTPPGTSWADFSFHERRDGRIVVSIAEKRQFKAHGAHRDDGLHATEIAERDSMISRIHSLEEIRLRSDSGRLTKEGTAFTHLLRAGTIARDGNDVVVLKLAHRLREWTGLGGEPLRVVEASKAWTAIFTCSSDLKATPQ
jgi:hypothetical protein